MWCNHPFGQRNKALKKGGIGVCVGMCECMLKRGWGGGRQYRGSS